MNEFNLELNKNISIQNRLDNLAMIIDEAHQVIAAQLGVARTEVAFMRNGTEANNNVNNGQLLQPTDEVVLWAQNHPTNHQAWYIRQAQTPFVIHDIPANLNGAITDEEIVAQFVNEVNENTKFLTFSHLSNVSGLLLPAEQICRAVHSVNPDCHVHVDGAMTWGCMNLNLAQMDCDSYSASAHKWFLGPKETGLFYMKLSRIPNFTPNTFGYDPMIVVPEELYTDARRFELLGQRADPSLMCLLCTAEIMEDIGFQSIEDRVRYLGTIVFDGFSGFDFPMTTPSDVNQRLGVVIGGVDPDWGANLYNYLYDTHRIAVASTSGIRASPHICNIPDQLQSMLDAIEEYIGLYPPPPPPETVIYSKW
ncbi:cysteine desulfurase SufS-like [Xenia sp. Carnegie-2017]|nr:cysteine desulfurase SufS-like [Xenia sp. Carnegie-2017]